LNPTAKKTLSIGIPLILAIFFGWYMFSQIPISTIAPYFKNADYRWVLLGVFFGLLSHLSRAYRWRFQLEPMGYNIKLPNSIMAVFITYLTNYGIPRSGEVLRAALLTNYEKVPFEKGFGTIIAERVADLVVMAGIILITLTLQFDFIIDLLSKSFQPQKLLLFILVGLVLITAIVIFIRKSNSRIAVRIKKLFKGVLEGILSIFKMKKKWPFIFHTLFIWFMYVLMFYVTTFAIKDLDGIPIGAVLIAFIAASFTIAATNGGVFFYPAAVLGALLLFGLPKEPSYAFGWIIWTSQTIMILIFGILSFVFLPIYNRKK